MGPAEPGQAELAGWHRGGRQPCLSLALGCAATSSEPSRLLGRATCFWRCQDPGCHRALRLASLPRCTATEPPQHLGTVAGRWRPQLPWHWLDGTRLVSGGAARLSPLGTRVTARVCRQSVYARCSSVPGLFVVPPRGVTSCLLGQGLLSPLAAGRQGPRCAVCVYTAVGSNSSPACSTACRGCRGRSPDVLGASKWLGAGRESVCWCLAGGLLLGTVLGPACPEH